MLFPGVELRLMVKKTQFSAQLYVPPFLNSTSSAIFIVEKEKLEFFNT